METKQVENILSSLFENKRITIIMIKKNISLVICYVLDYSNTNKIEN